MSTSVPQSSFTASLFWLKFRMAAIFFFKSAGDNPPAILSEAEWSQIATHEKPRAAALRAISNREAVPSLYLEWTCRSPRISFISTKTGSCPARAASISPLSSLNSGGIYGNPTALKTSFSVLPPIHFSPRNTPYSLIFKPRRTARSLTRMLCALEPVK